jgi:DNA-binding Xre family transcriptional regulator
MGQRELARVSGVSLSTISRLATNSTGQVSLDVLDRLAAALNVKPGDLIALEKPKRRGK